MVTEGEGRHGFDHGDCAGKNAGVMSSAGFELDVFEVGGDGLLGMEDGGGGFECDAEEDVLSVGDAALDAAGPVGGGPDFSVAHSEGVVVGFSREEGAFKAGTDFKSFCRGKAEHSFGEIGFEFIEDGFAETCGSSADDALNDTADGIALGADFFDSLDHLGCCVCVGAPDHVGFHLIEAHGGWVHDGLDVLDRADVCNNFQLRR